MPNIVETAVSAGTFKTLVQAVKAAGLVETLSDTGPFTVFAPDDNAFAKLPADTVKSLISDIPKLKNILTYHVVAGLTSAKTVQGKELSINTKEGVKVNEAKVIKADIEADNGVIHVIDSVPLP